MNISSSNIVGRGKRVDTY